VSGVGVLCPSAPGVVDGVREYARFLAVALERHVPTRLLVVSTGAHPRGARSDADTRRNEWWLAGWRAVWRARAEPPWRDCDTWVVQYVPQVFWRSVGREWPWLFLWLLYTRVVRAATIVITAHEYNVPWAWTWKRVVGRIAFDGLCGGLGVWASHVVVTHGHNRRKLARLLFWKGDRIAVIPVGSTIGDPGPEGLVRRSDPSGGGRAVCVLFGDPAAAARSLVSALGAWLSAHPEAARLVWIARSREAVLALWRGECGLPPDLVAVAENRASEDVSRLLGSATVFLAPIVDGVSTRRTTVMAALAHGLPIVGTDGPCTDEVLRTSEAFALSPPEDGQAWIAQLERVLGDAALRARMGRAARALYESRFTWDRIAAAYLALLKADARERGS